MDMLETGCGAQCAHANGREPNMTDTEWRTEFSMWAISASPLQFTSPLMNCTAAPAPPAPSCSVRLLEQRSSAACSPGVGFGCDASNAANNSMFTDAGCRGVFDCNGANVTPRRTAGDAAWAAPNRPHSGSPACAATPA